MTPHCTIEHLLRERAPGGTICPSEVARALWSGDEWREHMEDVHTSVDEMLADGTIRLSWKGVPMDNRDGPYRIALADR